MSTTPLLDQVVDRRSYAHDGNSGNPIERVTLRDGQRLLLKRISPEWDWIARAAHDRGRLGLIWEARLLERAASVVDHAIVAVENDGRAWNVFMRDVSSALLSPRAKLDRSAVRRVLAAAAGIHEMFWGERHPELCDLADRYALFSPATGRRELQRGSHHGVVFTRGWDAFGELVPGEIAAAIFAILDRPEQLAAQLDPCEQTLIHGDLRLGNLGFSGDRVVLLDWGERVGSAPPAVELAWFIGFDALRLEVSNDDVIADFRALYGRRCEETALQLSLLGGLVQLGGLLGYWIIQEQDEAVRAARIGELSWWTATVEKALRVWSPI
jgi:hypothetical protein